MGKGEGVQNLLNWNNDAYQICEIVASRHAQVKVILKTKNETSLLSDWIEHHTSIFGDDGVVIFDHMSDSSETFKLYEKFKDRVPIFQYSGMIDRIHNADKFIDLYRSIRSSCDFYSFIDTDEFLFWYEVGGELISDSRVINRILNSNEKIIPGIWVNSLPLIRNTFLYSFSEGRMQAGLRGGKPMISSGLDVSGFINHNNQLSPSVFSSCATANLVVHHLKNYSPEQRVKSNLEKLRNYNRHNGVLEPFGLVGESFTIDDILKIDPGSLRGKNAGIYISEIKYLSDINNTVDIGKRFGNFATLRDGRLFFSDMKDKHEIDSFTENPREFMLKTFGV